jgi:hypothetical protein
MPPERVRASTEEIMKAARDSITSKIPVNLLDEFVVQMLNTIDVVYEQSRVGRQLLFYVGSFIPRNLKTLCMPLCLEQVYLNGFYHLYKLLIPILIYLLGYYSCHSHSSTLLKPHRTVYGKS